MLTVMMIAVLVVGVGGFVGIAFAMCYLMGRGLDDEDEQEKRERTISSS